MTITKFGQWNFSFNVYYLYPWVYTYNSKSRVTIKISHLSSLFSKYLSSVYVPEPVLDAGDNSKQNRQK